ncbi:MAG: Chemotaxis protein methyltransferase CheR [Verrucomicrobia bacterium]|nr:Chemotaxis protein methyltransferase CheR [Verrucomicrobiota bacterium]
MSHASPHSETQAARKNSTETGAPSLAHLRLLVVDDERDSRLLMRRVLEARGAQVRLASTADEAIQLLSLEPFDVLISDIGLPGEDGYQLIRRVRALPAPLGGSVPAVALTAYTRTEDRARAIRAGFHMHVTKPVEARELIVVVASMARIREASAPAPQ